MGFLDNLLKGATNSATGAVSSAATNAANTTARNAANKAMNPNTYAGLNPKAISDKTTFFVRKDGKGIDVYFDNRLVQNITPQYIDDLKNKPEQISRTELTDKFAAMRPEFKNKEVGKLLVQKFFDVAEIKF
ncbi:MAG: hypothetical protein ABII22_06150 [Candidatus Micrarchaeota archaeon]